MAFFRERYESHTHNAQYDGESGEMTGAALYDRRAFSSIGNSMLTMVIGLTGEDSSSCLTSRDASFVKRKRAS